MRLCAITLGLIALGLAPVEATTLQLLSTDQMIAQSTAIVRVQVAGSAPVMRGRAIYTVYQFSVLETLKAAPGGSSLNSVSVPGGALQGVRQMVAGAPALSAGEQYVIFLWTSPSGLTQIIGLSQGLFNVMQDSSGNQVLVRPPAAALVLSQNGSAAPASAITMTLSALRAEIQKVLN